MVYHLDDERGRLGPLLERRLGTPTMNGGYFPFIVAGGHEGMPFHARLKFVIVGQTGECKCHACLSLSLLGGQRGGHFMHV